MCRCECCLRTFLRVLVSWCKSLTTTAGLRCLRARRTTPSGMCIAWRASCHSFSVCKTSGSGKGRQRAQYCVLFLSPSRQQFCGQSPNFIVVGYYAPHPSRCAIVGCQRRQNHDYSGTRYLQQYTAILSTRATAPLDSHTNRWTVSTDSVVDCGTE